MTDLADYDFSTGDAGASHCYNIEAGQIRVGGYVIHLFYACIILLNYFLL